MNYFTLKKAVTFSMFLMLGFTAITNAQQSTTTASSTAKVFGGRAQYRTWSLGVNAGALSPRILVGSTKDYSDADLNLGYGLTLRKQLGHSFGLEGSFLGGKISGSNEVDLGGTLNKSFETKFNWSGSLMGVINVATADFIKRENGVNFLVKFGYGYVNYSYKTTSATNVVTDDGTKFTENYTPVGLGVKFKVSNRVNFDLGYNMNILINSDDLDGAAVGGRDNWSYTYGGLEFSLGNASKPNLDWTNPVALMYDELKDPELRKEVDALKGRVSTLEAADLLKDSDGDGVADKLDKCANTEAGVKVDGSGCALDVDNDGVPDSKDSCPTEKGTTELNGCPAATSTGVSATGAIQFEFNSSVLKTDSYPALDQLSSDLRSGTVKSIKLEGHASEEGTPEYNMQLSKDRANAVKTYLVNSGVAANKVSTKGFGETRPIASNETEEGRQLNRRVDLIKQ